MIFFKAYKKLMGGVFLFLILAILNQSCGGGGGSSSGGGGTPQTRSFSTVLSSQALSSKYANSPTFGIISVDFTDTLNTKSNQTVKGSNTQNDVTKLGWLKLFLDGSPVEGKVLVGNDGRSLIFIPSSFLKPDTNYTVIIPSVVKSSKGELLNKNIKFSFNTGKIDNVINLNVPSYVKEGEEFEARLSTAISEYSVDWDMDKNSSKDKITHSKSTISYTYDEPGTYTVSVTLKDKYGRSKTESKIITVTPNPLKALANSDNLSGVQETGVDSIEDDTFRNAINDVSENNDISIAEAEQSSNSKASGAISSKFICVSMKTKALSRFPETYINSLAKNGEFLGLVSFSGFPAILSFKTDENGYKLNIAAYDYGVNIEKMDLKNYEISNIKLPPLSSSPLLYFISINVSEDVINRLKNLLPKKVNATLPILHVTGQGAVMLATQNHGRGFGDFVDNIIDYGKDALSQALSILENLVSKEVYSALKKFKNYLNEMKSLKGFSKIGDFISAADSIKSEFNSLYNKFGSDPQGILSGYADPDKLFEDLGSFIYKKGSKSLKTLIDKAMKEIQSKNASINVLLDKLNDHKSDFFYFISGFIPDTNKDSCVYFVHNESQNSIVIRNGANSYDISASTLETFSQYSEAFTKEVGVNFPLTYITDIIDNIINRFPSIMSGFFYDSSNKEFKFLSKIGSTSSKECSEDLSSKICFGEYLAKDMIKSEIGANLSQSTGILLSFSPLSPILPTVDGAGALYSFLSKNLGAYPELKADIRTRYRNKYIEIQGSTHPTIGISGGVEFAIELDYHVLFGGKGKISLLVSVGVDPAGLINGVSSELDGVLKKIVKDSFNAAKGILSQSQITSTTINMPNGQTATMPMIKFPSDAEFLKFVNQFLSSINSGLTQKGLSTLEDSISFDIGVGTEIGAGVGGGGTGTGGASLDGKLKFGIGINFDLPTALQAIDFFENSNVSSFIITPLKNFLGLLGTLSDEGTQGILSGKFVTQIGALYFKTFKELLKNMSSNSDSLKELFNKMANRMSVSVSISEEGEAEAEEGASGSVEVSASPSISVNGETLFNILYAVINNPALTDYLDHVGVYPQISFGFPVSAEVEGGIDEGIKIAFKGGVQADFFSAKLTIKNDPYATNGVHSANPTTLKLPLSATLSSDKTDMFPNDVASLTCSTAPSNAPVEWYVAGLKVSSTGSLYADNGTLIANVVSLQGHNLKISKLLAGKTGIVCIAQQNGNTSFDSLDLRVRSSLSGVPDVKLSLDNVGIVDNSTVTIVPVDDIAGYPLSYTVQISETQDFRVVLKSFDVTSTEFTLPSDLKPARTYYIRVKATDGLSDTPFSKPKSFCTSFKFILYSPQNNASFHPGDNVTFKVEVKGAGGDDLIAGLNAELQISIDKEFDNITWWCNYDEIFGFDTWIPDKLGTYYWRVKGTWQKDENEPETTVYSKYRTIKIVLSPPKLKYPNPYQPFNHRTFVSFSVFPVSGADRYEYQLSDNRYFSHIVREDNSTTTSFTVKLPTLDSQPYTREYYWRVRAIKDDIYGSWSKVRTVKVINHPPYPYFNQLNTTNTADGMLCVGDNATIMFYVNDLDNDNITSYRVEILSKPAMTLLRSYTINKFIENKSTLSVTVPIEKSDGYGDITIRIIPMDQWGASLETTESKEDEEHYLYYYWQESPLNVINCPPPAVKQISYSPSGTIIPDQNVYLLVDKPVEDPDGDTIVFYEFYITDPGGNHKTITVSYGGQNNVSATYTPSVAGNYVWKVRAIAKLANGVQYGIWSATSSFSVSPPPPVENIYPENGAIVGKDTITLGAKPSDNISIRAMQFQTAKDKNFTEIEDLSPNVVTKDSKGVYIYSVSTRDEGDITYWHARASYEVAPGEWSNTYCFTHMEYVPPAEFSADNNTFYRINGKVSLKFNAEYEIITNCLNDNGTFEYEICTDSECSRYISTGNFTPGKPFDLDLDFGTYYFSGRQHVGGIYTKWSDPVQFSVESAEPFSEGLLAHYSFDNCSAYDDSEHGNDGTIEGEPTCTVESAKNKSFEFNGKSDYIDISSSELDSPKLTLTAWINPDNVSSKHYVASNDMYGIFIEDGKLEGYVWINSKYVPIKSLVGIPKNMWSFASLTYDGSVLKLYLNGKLAAHDDVTGNIDETQLDFSIGAILGEESSDTGSYFSGYIDEVRIYDRALSEDEIKNLMLYDENNMPDGLISMDNLTATPSSGDIPFQSELMCEAESGAVYKWDFDGDYKYDEETESGKVYHTYKRAGNYRPAVIAYKANGIYNWAVSSVSAYVPENMVLYWPFDGNGQDYSNDGYNASLIGNPSWVKGADNLALNLSNSSQYAATSRGVELNGFKLSFYVKVDSKSEGDNIFIYGPNRDNETEMEFSWNPDNETLKVCLKSVCGSTTNTIDLNDGKWHFISYTYTPDKSEVDISVDNKSFDTVDISTDNETLNVNYLVVGKNKDGEALFGSIDEVKLYNE